MEEEVYLAQASMQILPSQITCGTEVDTSVKSLTMPLPQIQLIIRVWFEVM